LKINRKAATGAVATLSLLALAACSSSDNGGDNGDDSGINQETSVNVAWESPLNETNTSSVNGNATQNANITYLTTESFNFYDPDLKLQKNTSFGTYEKTSDDPLTVKYTLSDKAQWSDGTPVTAADMLLQWAGTSGALNTVSPTETDDEGNPIYDATKDVYFDGVSPGPAFVTKTPEISDDGKTITFVYDKPYGDWELNFTSATVPAHIAAEEALGIEDATDATDALVKAIQDKDNASLLKVAEFWNHGTEFTKLPSDPKLLVANGPYLITDFVENQYLTLKKNPKYKGDHGTGPDTITVRYVDDPMGQVQALQNGEVDLIGPQASADVLTALQALKGAEIDNAVEGTYEHVDLVFDNAGPFDPKTYGGDAAKALAVRKAFLTAMPRQEIVDNLIVPLNPKADVRNSFILLPGSPNYDDMVANNGSDQYPLKADPAKAAQILAEAGVTGPINVRLAFNGDNPRRVNELALMTESEAAAGFTMVDASAPATEWGTKLATQQDQYDASLFGWQSNSTAVTESDANFRTNGINNYGHYSNTTVDGLFDQLAVSTDPKEQYQIQLKVEQELWKDAFGTTIFQFPGIHAWSSKLTGPSPISISPTIFYGFWDWKIAPTASPSASS